MAWKGINSWRAQRMQQRALDRIAAGDGPAAVSIGQKLCKMGWSGGLEIQALALLEMGKPAGAISILKEGVEVSPQAWRNWQLLGNLEDDAGNHEVALQAYASALKCARADRRSLTYNRALALWRAKRTEEAVAAAREVVDGAVAQGEVDQLAVRALAILGELHPELASDTMKCLLSDKSLRFTGSGPVGASETELNVEHAFALLHGGNREEAAQIAASIDHEELTDRFLELKRRVAGKVLDKAQEWRIVVHGVARPGKSGLQGPWGSTERSL